MQCSAKFVVGACLAAIVFAFAASGSTVAAATGQSTTQAKLAQLQAAMEKNRQMLAQYTWQQQETVSVNGEVKKQELYAVQMGPNGKPVKAVIVAPPATSGRQRLVKRHIEKSYEDYGKQIGELAQSYTQPDPVKLKQLYAQGNVALKSGGAPGIDAIVVSNYAKQGDTVTFSFNPAQHALLGINVASYLSDPSDAVTINVQFAKLPDGTNHVSTATINGQSKNVTVVDTNMNYQKSSQ